MILTNVSLNFIDIRMEILDLLINKEYKMVLELINTKLPDDVKEDWEMFYLYLKPSSLKNFITKYLTVYTAANVKDKTIRIPDLSVLNVLLTQSFNGNNELTKPVAALLYDRIVDKDLIIAKIIKMKVYLKYFNPDKEKLIYFRQVVDDWTVYEYALDHNIDIYTKNTKSINMMWYNSISQRIPEDGIKLLGKLKDFSQMKKLFDYFEIEGKGNKLKDILILEEDKILYRFLTTIYLDQKKYQNEYLEKEKVADVKYLLNLIWKELKVEGENTSTKNPQLFVWVKLALGIILSDMRQSNLILAVYLIEKIYPLFNCNELKVISMFVYRFFCFYQKVHKIMTEELSIKNIQKFSYSYILNDIVFVLNKPWPVINLTVDSASVIDINKKSAIALIEKGCFESARSCLSVIRKLKKEVSISEGNYRKILGNERCTVFTDFLGDSVNLLFDKITVDYKKFNIYESESSFGTLYDIHLIDQKKRFEEIDLIFENSYLKIEDLIFKEKIRSLFIERIKY